MTQREIARKEVELACKLENPDWTPDSKEFDYGCACYQSALKAFESLCDDGHSGYSFSITSYILQRLLNELPLTPITENDFGDEPVYVKESDKSKSYQCYRKSSLFKHVYVDGKVEYSDVDRVSCTYENNTHLSYHSTDGDAIVDKMFPIKMPYKGDMNRYIIYMEDFLSDGGKGDFDTRWYKYMITPNKERIELNIYLYEVDGKDVNITKEEYEKLRDGAIKAKHIINN